MSLKKKTEPMHHINSLEEKAISLRKFLNTEIKLE